MKGIFTIFAIFLLLSSCGEKKQAAPTGGQRVNAPVQAEAFVVRSRDLDESIETPGTILPQEQTEIRPEISGRLVALYFKEGSFVRKGALLAKLFDQDLQAQLKKLQVQLAIARQTFERQSELLEINGISRQEVDLSELQVNNIQADIQLLKVDIARTEIRAPYDGRVGLRNISLGAYVTPTNVLTTLRQVSQLKLEFTVPERYSESFTSGKTVRFTITGVRKEFTASVIATESSVEVTTRSLRVRATIRDQDEILAPGVFAKVALDIGNDSASLVVPTQAIIPQARNKQVILYANGKPTFQTVATGIRDSAFVQILEGLKAGDTVLTTGLLAIRPESQVRISKVQ